MKSFLWCDFTKHFPIVDEYIKYFTWKYEWRVDFRHPICGLCDKLHEPQQSVSIIDLDKEGEKSCKKAEDLPWMILRYN